MKTKEKTEKIKNNDNNSSLKSWWLICIHLFPCARDCCCFNSFYIVLIVFGMLKALIDKGLSIINMTFLMSNMTFLMRTMTFLMSNMTFLMRTMTFLMFDTGFKTLNMTFLMSKLHSNKLNMTFLMFPMTNFKKVIYNNWRCKSESL